MTDHHGPIPVPARITIALDAIDAEGPQVDIDLGGVEPMVDEWEDGTRVPTRAQIERLAEYTGFLPEWFYRPADELGGPMRLFICDRGRRGDNGLTILNTHVSWDGVLHVEQETPDRPPRRPPKPKPAPASVPVVAPATPRPGRERHTPVEDADAPGCCECGLPMTTPNFRHLARRPG